MTTPSSPPKNGLAVYVRLLGYVRAYWAVFGLSLLGYLMFALSQPMFPKLVDYFATALIGDSSQTIRIWGLGSVESQQLASLIPLGIVVLALFRGLGSFLGNYCLARVSLGVIHDLRVHLFDSLLRLPSRFFSDIDSGHLVSRITYNVSGVTSAATEAIKVSVREGLTVIALLGYLFWTNWKLTLVFLAIAPVIAAIVTFTSRRFRKLGIQVQDTMGDITHIASETITNHAVVRSFGGQNYENQRFVTASADNTHKNLKMAQTAAIMTPTLQMLILCAMAALMYALLFLQKANIHTNTPGELIGFLAAAGLLPKPLRQLSEVMPNIQKGLVAAWSVFNLIDQEPEQDTGTRSAARVAGAIEVRNLSFTYGSADKPALQDISFRVEPGETLALVGRSGSGKSTLIGLLLRFHDPDRGQVLLDGVPLTDYCLSGLRRQIALVSQQVSLFNDTVANNIAYGDLADAEREDIRLAARSACATEFIEAMPQGLDTPVGERGVRLSGGQRQRLALARAILKDAPILVLDEATSALDTESERHIQMALDTIARERTTLIIAHRLSTIEKADRILVLDKGRIVESGTQQELLARPNGTYAALHNQLALEDENKSTGLEQSARAEQSTRAQQASTGMESA